MFRLENNPIEDPVDRVADTPAPVAASPIPSRYSYSGAATLRHIETPLAAETVAIPTLVLYDSRVNVSSQYSVNSNVARTYRDNRASIVRINTVDNVGDSAGSGFIVGKDGLIATGYHVVKDASSIRVRLENGKSYKATVRDLDVAKDLALLQIEREAPTEQFPVAVLEAATPDAPVNRKLVALGYPRSVEVVHVSEVTAKSNETLSHLPITGGLLAGEDVNRVVVKSVANVAKGNSGGPVLDADTGRVVGVVNLSNQVDTYFNPVEDLQRFLARVSRTEVMPGASTRHEPLPLSSALPARLRVVDSLTAPRASLSLLPSPGANTSTALRIPALGSPSADRLTVPLLPLTLNPPSLSTKMPALGRK